VSNIISKP